MGYQLVKMNKLVRHWLEKHVIRYRAPCWAAKSFIDSFDH